MIKEKAVSSMIGLGTIINTVAVILGGALGMLPALVIPIFTELWRVLFT